MKRTLLLTIMCVFALFGNVKAQEVIEVGKSSFPSWCNPIADYFNYSVVQQIYTAEDLQGKTGTINKITFDLSTGATTTRDVVVYMKNIDKTAFSSATDWVEVSDADIVFDGSWALPATLTSVMEVSLEFTKGFEYTGGDLLLCMYDKTGSAVTINYNQFYAYYNEAMALRTLYYSSASAIDVNNISSVSGTTYAYTNYIKFTITSDEGGETPDPTPDPEPEPDPTPDPEPGDDNEGGVTTSTIEVGADKNPIGSEYSLPTTDYVKYSISQQIYTEEDLGGNLGSINSVAFKLANNVGSTTRQYEIYVKHIDRENMIGGFEPVTAADKVFDGDVAISGYKDTWVTIPFDNAFNYTGGNFVLFVYDKTGVAESANYHLFYMFNPGVEKRAYFSTSSFAYDVNNLPVNYGSATLGFKDYVNQVRFGMETKPVVKVTPEAIDLGETMLGGYWSEEKPYEVSVKAVSTTIKDIKVDNDFFVLPANIDYTANPIVVEVAYNENAEVNGEVKGNFIVSYEDLTMEVPMTANAYTPATGDVYELAKNVTMTDGKYSDTPEFAGLHDNYLLPGETQGAVTPDAVYTFELPEASLLLAKVEGTNAKMAVYKESFEGKGGPSFDNAFKGNIEVKSEFFFDFNEDVLNGWTVKNAYNNANNWQMLKGAGVDGTNCIVSYSYKTYPDQFFVADNFIMTEYTYNITENSKLSFDAMCDALNEGDIDHVKVKVSKDGESMTLIEEITPTSATYSNNVIDLGAKFAELGLEYGDYHIVLHHQETSKFYVCVDNIRLSNPSDAKTRGESDVDEIYAVEYPAGKYYVVVAAESEFTFELQVVNPENLPATPANVVATTIDEFSIELTWEAAENATSYNIYRNDEFVANVTELTYIDEKLNQNSDYCYIVRGYNGIMESVASEKACAKTLKLTLTPPTEIFAKATSTSTIVLNWSKVEKAAGYKVYWGEEVIEIVSDTTYTVEGLTAGTEYCYTVSSVNKTVESFDKSDFACATTSDIVPTIPANVKVEATSTMSVKVSWDASDNAKRYYIYSADTLVAKTTYTYYNIVGLESGSEYCYTVTAVNGEVESEESEVACGKTESDGIVELTSSINVYPNPVNDKLYIETEVEIEEVVVYTITGVIVGQQSTVNGQQTSFIDVTNLNSGVYFVKVVTENGETVKRIIKD